MGHSVVVVFHGFTRQVLFDLGDYAVHPALRNDLGLLWSPATSTVLDRRPAHMRLRGTGSPRHRRGRTSGRSMVLRGGAGEWDLVEGRPALA
ncbi:hypothetical protein OHB14_59720 [Streptomyces sp. NBC_01613]|uniref:hypothetical protein n=1 Tax=Streptomyces sp. NBC_01613 TaxID=2975896 RepID=UPI00386A2261